MALTLNNNIIKPQFDKIPHVLQQLPQWTVWTSRERADKDGNIFLTKEPVDANGRNIDWRNLSNLRTYEQVQAEYQQGNFNGVGFVLKQETPFVCVDLDNIDDITQMDASLHYLTNFTYTELSPSGTGLHLWFAGRKPDGFTGTKSGNVELFGGQDKFITVTGAIFDEQDAPTTQIETRPEIIQHIVDTYFAKKPLVTHAGDATRGSNGLSKSDVIKLIERFKPKTWRVFNGDFSEYASQSEAVMALLNDIAFYTAKDALMMHDVYMSSNATYADQKANSRKLYYTINKAIAGTKNSYMPKDKQPTVDVPATIVSSTVEQVQEMLKRNDDGKVLKTAKNVEIVLNNMLPKLAFDEFRQREVIADDLPWRKRKYPMREYEQWQTADDAQLRHFMRYNFNLNGNEMIMDALTNHFRKKRFHPVKIYINSTVWDKTPRIETFFSDYLGAVDAPYTRAVARKWFIAAVKRIYEPGCKFDYMPVLVGEQGVGKSTAVQKLAPEFFNDSLRNFDVKESGEVLQSSWIIEIGELAAMKKSEEDEMKGFLSRQVDIFRPAYARSAQEFPRHVVFMGTTNNYQFLKDTTGNRRFLPIQTSKNRKFTPWDDLDEMTVAQLWAEAATYYRDGENVDLDDEIKMVAKLVQAEYTESDVREGMIQDYLEMLLPVNWDDMSIVERFRYFTDGKQGTNPRTIVCVMEIWRECLGELDAPTRMDSNKIIGILSKLGWQPKAPSKKRFKHYSTQRAFVKQ